MIKNQWYAVASSKEIKEGQLVGMKRLAMDLVFFRKDGVLSALVDRCSHRGAALSKGKVKGQCLQCPFHGLEFGSDGQCEFVPAIGLTNEETDLTRYNVKYFHLREIMDIVFLWYGDTDPQGQPDFFDIIDETFKMGEIKDHWATHYSRSIENQLDVVHLPFVHHNTIGRGGKTLINGPKVLWLSPNHLQTSADNEVDRGQTPEKPDKARIKSSNLQFKYPNLWLNNIADKIKVLGFFAPIDEENTMVYFRFYNKLTGLGPVDKAIGWLGKWADFIVERQDRRVVITQRPKASSFKKSGENLLQGDRPIIEYRKRRQELKEEYQETLEKKEEI